MTATAHRISYWVKPNRYAATCAACGERVEPEAGWTQKEDAGWVTHCHPCARASARALPDGVGAVSMSDHKTSVPLYVCCGCGLRVGLVKSARGKWYFADVREGAYGEHRTKVRPWNPHTCQAHEVGA